MDSRSNNTLSGTLRSFGIVGAAFLYLFVGNAMLSWADPPPNLQALGRSQTLVLVDTSQPAIFPEQSWNLHAPNPHRATVAIWTIEPFRNVSVPQSLVDAQLNLRVINRKNHESWQVFVSQARTDFAHGANAARVVAASPGGNGEAGISVSFLGQELPNVAEGSYEATVVGTITEAF